MMINWERKMPEGTNVIHRRIHIDVCVIFKGYIYYHDVKLNHTYTIKCYTDCYKINLY